MRRWRGRRPRRPPRRGCFLLLTPGATHRALPELKSSTLLTELDPERRVDHGHALASFSRRFIPKCNTRAERLDAQLITLPDGFGLVPPPLTPLTPAQKLLICANINVLGSATRKTVTAWEKLVDNTDKGECIRVRVAERRGGLTCSQPLE